ncbi:MAG: TonB-dependent receptor [Rhodocyclaceae bacterium]|nr:TonB-dependent receptor [Rhodocyclaceae bacterium]
MKLPHAILVTALTAAGQLHAAEDFTELSLEDLVKAEVTSVSRKSQSLADVAAAAFVITAEDIRRSGAQSLPDVLRMAPGVEVAQIDNGRYAVSVRGFNGRFTNKLQVLVDGRSLYHPMFAGVVWELDPIPLEDIERIEVIRGPGAVMWGANAVNGLINIISKQTRGQAGGAVSVTAGTQGNGNVYARIGGAPADGPSWKLSAQGRYAEPSRLHDPSKDSVDRYSSGVVDFRLDNELGGGRDLSIWANASRSVTTELWNTTPVFSPMGGLRLTSTRPDQVLNNENLVGRYRWLSAAGVESSIQASIGRARLEIDDFAKEDHLVVDVDYQGRRAIGEHDLIWGLSHRSTRDDIDTHEPQVAVSGARTTIRQTGVFLHDDWTLLPERLKLGIGGRLDRATGNGTEASVNTSLLWTPTRSDSVWIKAARAPRFSSRGERDISILTGVSLLPVLSPAPGAPGMNVPVIGYFANNSHLGAEKAKGIELGYRKQFAANLGADLSIYRQRYTDLRGATLDRMYGCHPMFAGFGIAFDPAGCGYFGLPAGLPVMFNVNRTANNLAGTSRGAELAVDWLVSPGWRLQLSHAWSKLDMDSETDPIAHAAAVTAERSSPRHYGSLRSQWNIAADRQFDVWLRGSAGIDRVKQINLDPASGGAPAYHRVPGYVTLDLRYAHRVNKDLELALVGRNLIARHRLEYISDFIPTAATEVAPSWAVTARWKF